MTLRSQVVKKNILQSILFKALYIFSNLLVVPILLKNLSDTDYGTWVTMYSLIAWFALIDIGFGHGFRNKIAKALGENNKELTEKYIHNLYSVSLIVVLFGIILLSGIYSLFNLKGLFQVKGSQNLDFIIINMTVLFLIGYVCKSLFIVLYGAQKSSFVDAIQSLVSFSILVFLFIVGFLNYTLTINSVMLIYMLTPIIILIFSSIYIYKRYLNNYKYRFQIDKTVVREVFSFGGGVFLVQIAALILFSSGNFILTYTLGADSVVPYNIAFRLFSVGLIIFNIILSPYWSAFTEAFTLKDVKWVEVAFYKLKIFWLFYSFLVFVVVYFSEGIYELWLGNEVKVNFRLSLYFGIYVVLLSWCGIHSQILNGLGKAKEQVWISLVQIIIYFCLLFVMINFRIFEVQNVIFSINISLILPSIALPFVIRRKLNHIKI